MVFPPESLYIHIPFCFSKCSYCDFFSKPVSCVTDDYVNALCHEISWRLSSTDYKSNKIKTVYIGGGTPSLLSKEQILQIADVIPKNKLCEFTFEVNPDDVTKDLLDTLNLAGVTRISCGIQSLSDKVLSFCNRRSDRKQVLIALDLFNKYWKKDLSVDLISALPFETEDSFLQSISTAVNSGANHISLYSLTIEENTPMGHLFETGALDYDFDAADKMWLLGKQKLQEKGFMQYEVSNFSKKGKESLHNMTYWNHKSYLGCGSGGTGTVYKKDGTAFRWTNSTKIAEYIDFWNRPLCDICENKIPGEKEILSKEVEKYEFFMMGLRTLNGISEDNYQLFFNEKLPDNFVFLFKKWEEKGLSKKQNGFWALTEEGILFLNKFLEELDI